MPKFDLRRMFQCVSLLALDCGIAAFMIRVPAGPWLVLLVLVIPFLLGAAIGVLYDKAIFGGSLAVIAAFPLICFVWLVRNMLGGLILAG